MPTMASPIALILILAKPEVWDEEVFLAKFRLPGRPKKDRPVRGLNSAMAHALDRLLETVKDTAPNARRRQCEAKITKPLRLWLTK